MITKVKVNKENISHIIKPILNVKLPVKDASLALTWRVDPNSSIRKWVRAKIFQLKKRKPEWPKPEIAREFEKNRAGLK